MGKYRERKVEKKIGVWMSPEKKENENRRVRNGGSVTSEGEEKGISMYSWC